MTIFTLCGLLWVAFILWAAFSPPGPHHKRRPEMRIKRQRHWWYEE